MAALPKVGKEQGKVDAQTSNDSTVLIPHEYDAFLVFLKSRRPRFIGEAYKVKPIDISITTKYTSIVSKQTLYLEGGEDVKATPPEYDMCCVDEAPHAYWARCLWHKAQAQVTNEHTPNLTTSISTNLSAPTLELSNSPEITPFSEYAFPGPITRWNPSADNCTLKGDSFNFCTAQLHVNQSLHLLIKDKFSHIHHNDVDYVCEGTLTLLLPV